MMAPLVVTMAAAAVAAGGKAKAAPHILFLLADDYGWNDIGVGVLASGTGMLAPFFMCRQ